MDCGRFVENMVEENPIKKDNITVVESKPLIVNHLPVPTMDLPEISFASVIARLLTHNNEYERRPSEGHLTD